MKMKKATATSPNEMKKKNKNTSYKFPFLKMAKDIFSILLFLQKIMSPHLFPKPLLALLDLTPFN